MHCNSKFVPWRVRDLASCFYICHIPLEKEPEISIGKPRIQSSRGSKVFDLKSGHKGSVKLSTNAKRMCNIVDGEGEPMERSSSRNKAGMASAEGRSRREATFVEEDYIVFDFKEDGNIHLIDEENSTEDCHKNDQQWNTTTSTSTTNITPKDRKEDEKGSNEMGTKWSPSDGEETKDIKNHVEQANTSKMYPLESCASSESETSSASSFAFPELGVEWTGSPVHMPRAEKQETEPYDNILYCYRF